MEFTILSYLDNFNLIPPIMQLPFLSRNVLLEILLIEIKCTQGDDIGSNIKWYKINTDEVFLKTNQLLTSYSKRV